MSDSKNNALKKAILDGTDVTLIRELLDQGADPYYLLDPSYLPDWRNVKKLKFYRKYQGIFDYHVNQKVFGPDGVQYVREISENAVKYRNDKDFLRRVFSVLGMYHQAPAAFEMLQALFDNGIPIDGYICSTFDEYLGCPGCRHECSCSVCHDCEYEHALAPIHLAVIFERTDLISWLLKRRASHHKTTGNGRTCLQLSVRAKSIAIVEFLLKNGAYVNQRRRKCGTTALHVACKSNNSEMIHTLLKYGARICSSDFGTPLDYSSVDRRKNFVKILAKLKFDGHPVCNGNVEYLKKDEKHNYCNGRRIYLHDFYENCMSELGKMKAREVYDDLSLYDILNMTGQRDELVFLTKNEDFVVAFNLARNSEFLECFGGDLDSIFGNALERINVSKYEGKIYESSLDKEFSLPPKVVQKIAYFSSKSSVSALRGNTDSGSDFDYDSSSS